MLTTQKVLSLIHSLSELNGLWPGAPRRARRRYWQAFSGQLLLEKYVDGENLA